MFKYRYGKRVWMTLLALLMLMSCASGETPPQPTRIVQAQEQVQESGMVKVNSVITYQAGNTLIIATVYDNPETEENVDMICQTSVSNAVNPTLGGAVLPASVAVNCQRMN